MSMDEKTRKTLSDTDAEILKLIQGLTLAQQMDALNHALSMLVAKQETLPSPAQTSDEHTP